MSATVQAVNVGPDRRPAKAGEFQWRIAHVDENGIAGYIQRSRPAREGETPNELWIWIPGREWFGMLPLTAHPFPHGDVWEWDGNLDAPTLTPSIDAKPLRDFAGWHGHLTAGVLIPC